MWLSPRFIEFNVYLGPIAMRKQAKQSICIKLRENNYWIDNLLWFNWINSLTFQYFQYKNAILATKRISFYESPGEIPRKMYLVSWNSCYILYKRCRIDFSFSQLRVVWVAPAICVSARFDEAWMKVAVTVLTFVTGASVASTWWNHTRELIWNISFWFIARNDILPSVRIFCVGETSRSSWFPDLLSKVMATFAKRSITSTVPPRIFSIEHVLSWKFQFENLRIRAVVIFENWP